MATKSFLKDITISKKKTAQRFVDALEEAHIDRYKPKQISKPVREIKNEQIKEFFGKK